MTTPTRAALPGVGYEFFDCLIVERRREGLLDVEPAGAPSDETEIIRWGAPCGRRVVKWLAVTRGGQPEVPAAGALSSGYVLLKSKVGAAFPLPTETGGQLWVMMGKYTYSMRKARPVDSDFPLGRLPIDTLGSETVHGIPAAKFLRSLLDNKPIPGLQGPLVLPTAITG